MSVPAYPVPRDLLKGKTVVVTAAAGTGIGFSAAKRAAEEGAQVLMSDFHERRLGEAADRIGAELGTRPATFVCDVTDQNHVDAEGYDYPRYRSVRIATELLPLIGRTEARLLCARKECHDPDLRIATQEDLNRRCCR